MDVSSFEFAANSTKEIIGFSTILLAATATFAKDTFLAGRTSIPFALGLSWLFYLLSIFTAIWTLLALTGELASSNLEPTIFDTNVVIPASIMCISFFLGICATALAGWQSVRQIVGIGVDSITSSDESEPPPERA